MSATSVDTRVDTRSLAAVVRRLEGLAEDIPMEKRAMYRKIGNALLAALRRRIGGTGKVQSWQERYVGSGGGYAAVRPKAKTYAKDGYPVGYITNSIENGHVQKQRWVPALGKQLYADRVPGKFFYADTRREADRIAAAAAEEFLEKLERRLEA